VSEASALERLRRLRGVTWEWRDDAPDAAKDQPGMGVIAQEVQAMFPELVTTTAEGHLQVDYDGLIPPLVEAVHELDARLRAVEERLG
jgi:trimeric autotransporter adhesin